MGFLNNKEKRLSPENQDTNIISGIEYIYLRAAENGAKNLFYDEKLNHFLPEYFRTALVKTCPDTSEMWFSIFALTVTHQRSLAVCHCASFFGFDRLEEIFLDESHINGGLLIYIIKKDEFRNFSPWIEKRFPIFNYSKIDDFLDLMPSHFEFSERLKLPVLVYLNDPVLYEYRSKEQVKYTERIEIKPVLKSASNNNNNNNPKKSLKESIADFKNLEQSIKFFEGSNANIRDLIISDSKSFPRFIENPDAPDIILFNLLNPIDYKSLNNITDNFLETSYENIYLYDNYNLLNSEIHNYFKKNENLLRFSRFIKAPSEKPAGFCIDDFKLDAMPVPPSFCMGCNLFTFLQKLKDQKSEEIVIIGDKDCFSLINSSVLRYSFPNIFIVEEPAYFISDLNIEDLKKIIFVFMSYFNFSSKIEYITKKIKNFSLKDKITFVIYNSIYDLNKYPRIELDHPFIKSVKTDFLKNNIRLKDIKNKYASLIFLENDCEKKTKGDKNYNYSKNFYISNDICNKFECKLCYQLTKCPAIKINIDNNVVVDPIICVSCMLCVDICPHSGIKLNKRKKVKIKDNIESKIELK